MLHTASAGDVALSAAFASRIGTWILWQRSKISSLQFYSGVGEFLCTENISGLGASNVVVVAIRVIRNP